MSQKIAHLRDYLKKLGACAVAFSGGQDSAFLLHHASEVLGERLLAVTITAPYTIAGDLEDAERIVRKLQVDHICLDMPLSDELRYNPENRCYLCKRHAFGLIQKTASARGFVHILDGTNADDLSDYRPGIGALRELEIESPLAASGIVKGDIRQWLAGQGDPLSKKAPNSCLMTRMPAGHEVTDEELRRIEKAEAYLTAQGLSSVRVRSDGKTARIEVDRETRRRFSHEDFMDAVSKTLKGYGYRYVSLDLDGYVMGNMNG